MNPFKNLKFKEGLLKVMVEDYMKKPSKFGQMGEPESSSIINLSEVSHEVVELTETSCRCKILDTPSGKILKDLSGWMVLKPLILGEYDENGVIISGEIISINAEINSFFK